MKIPFILSLLLSVLQLVWATERIRRVHEVAADTYVGGTFCQKANPVVYDVELCKARDEQWKVLGNANDAPRRSFTGECGPNCRPTCVTLLLDLNKLRPGSDLTCREEDFCQKCKFIKNAECDDHYAQVLFSRYPQCYLEDADCLGPTIYDNKAAYVTPMGNVDIHLDQCTKVPDDDVFCRFQHWPLVTPLDIECNTMESDSPCFNDPSKIYFEYCNIVEEEQCNDCKDDKCGMRCGKILEPFPPGWTTFVVSAPIPYRASGVNDQCDASLSYKSGSACFLERVQIYYPEDKDDCRLGCPRCHDCPLLQLGDRFGPLEVVGFGQKRLLRDMHESTCSSCDKQSLKTCGQTSDCKGLFQCDEAVECASGELLGLPSFFDNQCSFVDQERPVNEGSHEGMNPHKHPDGSAPKKDPERPGPGRQGIKGDAAESDTVIARAEAGNDTDEKHLVPILAPVFAVGATLLALWLYAHQKRARPVPEKQEESKSQKIAPQTVADNDGVEIIFDDNEGIFHPGTATKAR